MRKKRILIIDEKRFCRICSAILELEGYVTEIVENIDNLAQRLNNSEFGLIITSYPHSAFLLKAIKERNIPAIILLDHINKDLINTFVGVEYFHLMIKPLDYQRFRLLVREVMSGDLNIQGCYNIV